MRHRLQLLICLSSVFVACTSVAPDPEIAELEAQVAVQQVEPEAENSVEDPEAKGGEAAILYATGQRASFKLQGVSSGRYQVSIRARADAYQGYPVMRLYHNGQPLGDNPVEREEYGRDGQGFGEVALTEGDVLEAEFVNDKWGGSADKDRNLIVDYLILEPVAGRAAPELESEPEDPETEVITLPLEIIGPEGYSEEVTFDLDDPSSVDTLYLKAHRLAYRDASTNPDRGAKGSVRLNGGGWVDLSNDIAGLECFEHEAAYGCLNGAYHTVRLTLPISGAKAGKNTLAFRFNGTDKLTSGYRILELNLLDGEKKLLPEGLFVEDDPNDWRPPLDNANDIQAGQTLWEGAKLLDYPGGPEIKATCSGCHSADGRDLQYYAFSNWSIQERSTFHNLSELEGKQIASYIRSLDIAPRGRPWNPPYQPGPGLDDKPVEQWAAGAGLEAVLEEDEDMLGDLFPKGTSRRAMREVTDVQSTLNIRELPVALQFPDWQAWLPEVHPEDAWRGRYYEKGEGQGAYDALRRELGQNGADVLAKSGELPKLLGELEKGNTAFLNKGSTNKAGKWRVEDGAAKAKLQNGVSFERGKEAVAKLIAVKSWELMQEFGLEDRAPQIYEEGKGEVRAWPSRARSVFQVAPHIVADNKNNFADQDPMIGDLQSTSWYQLQMTLNAGQKQPAGERPMDWPYQQRHIRELAERTGVYQPLRFTATQIKLYQERLNGRGSNRSGFELRSTHPWWNYSDPRGDTSQMDALNDVQSGLRNDVVEALLLEFLDVVENDPHPSFQPENWVRVGHSTPSTKRWAGVEPANYVPQAYSGSGKLFEFPSNYHADNFYRLIPLLKDNGVDEQVLAELAQWCERMWPEGGWDTLF